MSNARTPLVIAGVLVAFGAVAAVAAIGGNALTRPEGPADLWLEEGAASSRPDDHVIAKAPGDPPADYAFVMYENGKDAVAGVWFAPRRSHVGALLQRLVHGRGGAIDDAAHYARTDETRELAGVTWRRFAADGRTEMK